MPSLTINLKDTDIIKLVLEFLNNRSLNISMLSVERESGIINGCYSDDLLFLRQLILDGQWDDVIDFINPLSTIESFDVKQFKYVIYKHKYLELLCIKSEYGTIPTNSEFTVDEVVKCLNMLEELCPAKEDYSNLCLLLTLPRLSEHVEYVDWNPSNARVECFKDILPLVEKFLVLDKKHDKISDDRLNTATNDRLVQLCVKGMLYESCVEYCQHKATSPEDDSKSLQLSELLNGTGFNDADISLLSWLQAIPHNAFSCPFEQRNVNVDLKPLLKPSLEASWCEQILVTPIKPKMFPHSAVPTTRPRSADFMSRSLQPQYDGLAHGLATARREYHAIATHEHGGLLSRSFGGSFQLNAAGGKRSHMLESVDRLFDGSETLDTHSSVLVENSPRNSPRNKSNVDSNLPRIQNETSAKQSIERSESPLTKQHLRATDNKNEPKRSETNEVMKTLESVRDSSTELYREYQRQRQLLQEQLAEQERRRQEYEQQLLQLDEKRLSTDDNRVIDSNANQGGSGDSRHIRDAWPEKEKSQLSNRTLVQQTNIANQSSHHSNNSTRSQAPVGESHGEANHVTEAPSANT